MKKVIEISGGRKAIVDENGTLLRVFIDGLGAINDELGPRDKMIIKEKLNS